MSRPTICLNLIMRDEAHVVEQVLQSAVDHIDYWVIVDTGSTDGAQDVVRRFFAERGVQGELHERPWRDFGTNRTEALELAAGKADYTWVIDADDLVVGNLDLTELTADAYELRYGQALTYWRTQVFRSSLHWVYEGVLHEYSRCLDDCGPSARLEGDYHIDPRHLGARSKAPDKYQRDAALLQRVVDAAPDDTRSTFYLAQSYFSSGQFDLSLRYYRRRAGMGGWDEEAFYAALRVAECLERLERPWSECLGAYLDAWQRRPSRGEPLCAIARHHRLVGEYDLAHLFATRAMALAYPTDERLFLDASVHRWRAHDEVAIAAYYIGRYQESFDLNLALLANPAVPESERERIEGNRDFSIPRVKDATLVYPAAVVRALAERQPRPEPQVTLTITTCRRLHLFEQTMNSFLNCCSDVDQIDRFVCIDDGSSDADRARMAEAYPFFEFICKEPDEAGHARSMNRLLDIVDSPYWLHLEDDWHYFAKLDYVTRTRAILDADPGLGQVAFNRNYAEVVSDRWIAGGFVFKTAEGVRFVAHQYCETQDELEEFFAAVPAGCRTNVHWPHYTLRASLLRTEAMREVGRFDEDDDGFERTFASRFVEDGWRTGFLDGVHCLHLGPLTSQRDSHVLNEYDLNGQPQFGHEPRRALQVCLLPSWTTGEALADLWRRQSRGDGRWDGIQLTAAGNADYWAIVNWPSADASFDPARTIVLQMEPSATRRYWADWTEPDPRQFLQVRSHEFFPNTLEWHLALDYSTLRTRPIEKSRELSTVVSGRTAEPGQRLRLAFVHELERSGVPIDIYGTDNTQGFRNYLGSLPAYDKSAGILPYRYTFAAENSSELNYVTEKLVDAIAGEALCFYWGCPNIDEIVDPQVLVSLPLEDPARSRALVTEAMANDLWGRRIEAIRAEKRRLLDEEQVLPMLARAIRGHQFLEALDVEVINLDRRPDRWASFHEAITAQLGERFARRCHRMSAVDGWALQRTPEIDHLFRHNDFGSRRGVVGCALSHLAIWQNVVDSDRPRLVLEDDARFGPGGQGRLAEFLGRLDDEHPQFGMALLGWFRWNEVGARPFVAHRVPRPVPFSAPHYMGGTFGYIVSPRGARALLRIAETEGVGQAIDWFVMTNAERVGIVVCDPDLVTAPLATSAFDDTDIQWNGEGLV